MLSQKIVERFVSEFLKGLHAFCTKQSELLPGLFVKLDAFANHGVDPGSQRTRRLCGLVCIEINIFGTLVVFFQRALKVLAICRRFAPYPRILQRAEGIRSDGAIRSPETGGSPIAILKWPKLPKNPGCGPPASKILERNILRTENK